MEALDINLSDLDIPRVFQDVTKPSSLTEEEGGDNFSVRDFDDGLHEDTLQDKDDILSVEEDDNVVSVGSKRHGDRLIGSSPKHHMVSSTIHGYPGFTPYVASGFPRATRELNSSLIRPTMALTTSSCATSSIGLLPTSHMIGDSIISPSGRLVPLTIPDMKVVNDIAYERVALEYSKSTHAPSMSIRNGSTTIPTLVSDFNKDLGSRVYVPRSVICLKDDGIDPAHARGLIHAMTPPILKFEAEHRTLDDLGDKLDLHSFQAAVSSTQFRRRAEAKISELSHIVTKLEEEKKVVLDDYSSLMGNFDILTKEKEDMSSRISSLSAELESKGMSLDEREKQLSESRSEIDKLRDELSKERKLRESLVDSIRRREAFLDAFPDLFRRLLDHPDFRVTFDAFNNVAVDVGELRGCVNVGKFVKENPSSKLPIFHHDAKEKLEIAGRSLKAKEFPIVENVPSMARSLGVPELLVHISSASAFASGSVSTFSLAPASASATTCILAPSSVSIPTSIPASAPLCASTSTLASSLASSSSSLSPQSTSH